MKFKLFLFSTCMIACATFFFSCAKDQEITNSNLKRNFFPSYKEFYETYDHLNRLEESGKMDQWSKEQGCTNLLNSEDDEFTNLSYPILAIMNENAEYQIGDSIIWYNEGILYRFHIKDDAHLDKFKARPQDCAIAGYIVTKSLGTLEDRTITLKGDGGLDARHQKEFNQVSYQPCGGTLSESGMSARKYVHEIFTQQIVREKKVKSEVRLRLKLEYKNSKGKWNPAGEEREMNVSIDGTTDSGNGTKTFFILRRFTCAKDSEIELDAVFMNEFFGPPQWTITVNGTITHQVMGDSPNNMWTNTGRPLW